MSRMNGLRTTVVLTLLLLAMLQPPVFASAASEYQAGLLEYNRRNYAKAKVHFTESIRQGNKTAIAQLYLGHSLYALGEKELARKTYFDIQCNCFGQPEAELAKTIVEKIDSERKQQSSSSGSSSSRSSSSGSAASGSGKRSAQSLANRIEIVAPKMGHAAVSDDTVRTIRSAITTIPAHVHETLVRGNTTIVIAPNIIDKWPDSIDVTKPGREDLTLAQEGGRTYGAAIHIYERAIIRGSTELQEMRPQSEIRNTFLHEVGHALDHCLRDASSDKTFREEYKNDVNDMPEGHNLSYFLQDGALGPFETFAECVGNLLGMNNNVHAEFEATFVRCKRWVRTRVKL